MSSVTRSELLLLAPDAVRADEYISGADEGPTRCRVGANHNGVSTNRDGVAEGVVLRRIAASELLLLSPDAIRAHEDVSRPTVIRVRPRGTHRDCVAADRNRRAEVVLPKLSRW